MSLTLTLTSAHPVAAGVPTSRVVTSGRLSIGRAAGNDWVLPDPGRVISKRHCVIEGSGGTFHIIDHSVNGVFINASDQPVGRDQRCKLQHGDRIRIGDYELDVAIDQPVRRDLPATGTAAEDGGEAALEPGTEAPLTSAQHLFDGPDHGPRLRGPAAAGGPTMPPAIPDDISLFGPGPSPKARPQPLTDLDRGAPIDAAFVPPRPAPPKPAQTAPIPEVLPEVLPEAPVAAEPAADVIPEDWDLGRAGPKLAPEPEPAATPAAKPPPPLPAIGPMENAVATAAPRPAAIDSPPPPQRAAGSAALVTAFLEGAGLDPAGTLPGIADPERMLRETGAILRTAVAGVIAVLETRRALKREMGAAATEFRPTENNPLKFTLGVDDTVKMLLTGSERGYLPAVAAVEEAFADIKGHQLAVLAAMQETWLDLLRRLDPKAIEQRLGDDAGLGALLSSKKARCWDAFLQLYETIAEDAETGYNSLFSRVFGHAYEQHQKRAPNKPE
ncbi:MAG: type VI secretion system-associated FHA domain protein TagH [Defluviicoccus sp.]|nr:type VI secretion system-associated FHA domain protein TagH [Defluviicoccus sp.]MDG4608529.1 type VI secretion system-associated FHA domain protein TagH [Defluviicoccus sp.]